MKSKEDCYYEATHKGMGDANGTRMDIVYDAMEIYAQQFSGGPQWIQAVLSNTRGKEHLNLPESNKDIFCKVNGDKKVGRILPFFKENIIIDYHFFEDHNPHGFALSNMKTFKWLSDGQRTPADDAVDE